MHARSLFVTLFPVVLAIGACQPHSSLDSRLLEPVAHGPNWPQGWTPSHHHERTQPLPEIRIDEHGDVTRTTVTPVVIDTREFPVQRQPNVPWEGPTARPGKLLPKHGRDKSLAEGPREDLPLGGITNKAVVKAAPRFPGISQTAWSPPDPTLAVGPDHIISTVNMAVAFYDKEGNEQFFANLDSTGSPGFFEEIGGGDFTFDPKCFYDHDSERFVILALEYYPDESWITIAVSDDSDPNGSWYKYRTPAIISIGNATYWVDYPGFGFDHRAFTVTSNLFQLGGSGPGFGGILYRVLNKTPMLSGDPVTFSDLTYDAGSAQCAVHHGEPVGPFFVSVESQSSMRIQAIRSPLVQPQLFTASISVPSNSGSPPNAPNPGGSIDTLDGRLMNVYWRDGQLVFAHAVESGNESECRWYHLDTGDWPGEFGPAPAQPTLVQAGAIDLPGSEDGFYPAVAMNVHGDIGLAFGHCQSNTNPSVRITGRAASDPPGTMGTPEIVVESPSGADGRWGDYFDMVIDPVDDTTFWYIGEWASSSGWQTWIGSFQITPPGCPGDTNGDGTTNVADLLSVIAAWNTDCSIEPGGCTEDVNGDGIVNVSDLLIVIANWNCTL
ncbi:MAG: dockerin type I domain-containing protein [Phycisphaerales bacterium]|nr:dockerin type I domain-containing protein [Phycisphaerales bacterium]